jgi:2-C-methyl-D-erythritol 4-phosphate cytidylyltransferase
VVALAAADEYWERLPLCSRALTVVGGAERSASVRSALAGLAGEARPPDWVLVHDAVRPCLDAQDLERLLTRLATHPVGGVLAVRVADTLKRALPGSAAEEGCAIEATQERAGLWRALTPQMFRYGALCAALDQAHAAQRSPSDEAQALEWAGARPLLIAGAASNLKVTTAEDLVLAAAILRARHG